MRARACDRDRNVVDADRADHFNATMGKKLAGHPHGPWRSPSRQAIGAKRRQLRPALPAWRLARHGGLDGVEHTPRCIEKLQKHSDLRWCVPPSVVNTFEPVPQSHAAGHRWGILVPLRRSRRIEPPATRKLKINPFRIGCNPDRCGAFACGSLLHRNDDVAAVDGHAVDAHASRCRHGRPSGYCRHQPPPAAIPTAQVMSLPKAPFFAKSILTPAAIIRLSNGMPAKHPAAASGGSQRKHCDT